MLNADQDHQGDDQEDGDPDGRFQRESAADGVQAPGQARDLPPLIAEADANANANANARTWESWGGRAGTAPGEFVMPMAISVGPGGRVEVADTGNDRIQIATLRPSTSA